MRKNIHFIVFICQLWDVIASLFPLQANVSCSPASTVCLIKVVGDRQVFSGKRKRLQHRLASHKTVGQTEQILTYITSNDCFILPYAVVTHVYPRLLRKILM